MITLLKKYTEELADRKKQLRDYKSWGFDTDYVRGIVTGLEMVIKDLKAKAMNDRFFLEEIVKKIHDEETEHYETLCREFLGEYVNGIPMTEAQRKKYIKTVLGFSDRDYYFNSEKELAFFLKNHRLPNDGELADFQYEFGKILSGIKKEDDYSIIDITANNNALPIE